MYIEQIYTACLAEASYYIESNGEAIVIDPIRDIDLYLQKAKERKASIKWIFETHVHADFVSGHCSLAEATGATIVFGPNQHITVPHHKAQDGETFPLGRIQFKWLHTPGHTPESSTILLVDENNKNHAIFTGDTLFIGDVGRPDLAIAGNLTQENLASMLYQSLQSKIMPLEDDVLVYPGHGAGSACGKNISKETWSTLGQQKRTNPALLAPDKDSFIAQVTTGIPAAPAYFKEAAKKNSQGYAHPQTLLNALRPFHSTEVLAEMQTGTLILDIRPSDIFAAGHIPGSWNIGLGGQFAIWAATLIPPNTPVILVGDPETYSEAAQRLFRTGVDQVEGYLEGGFAQWNGEVSTITSLLPEEVPLDAFILDVRKPGEYDSQHFTRAKWITLQDLAQEAPQQLDRNAPLHIHCAGGYRSMMAASILKSMGFSAPINIQKGFQALADTGKFDVTSGVSCSGN